MVIRVLAALVLCPVAVGAQSQPRAHDLSLPIGGTRGQYDAITDVAGVEVGHTTIVRGAGRLVVGEGPVRTGVTVIHPRGSLNDINGFHVRPEHVQVALDGARGGPVAEGNVGGGTGMICHGFKGGIGTASRTLASAEGGYTVGVLVQCNYGARRDLRIAGVPVGEAIPDLVPCIASEDRSVRPSVPRCNARGEAPPAGEEPELGSIIVVVATDAPLLPHQLKRIATRVSLGVGRSGGFGGNGSGDIFLAFATANPGAAQATRVVDVATLPNSQLNPLFRATVQATEEAIVNALLAAETMTGADDFRVYALPVDRLRIIMRSAAR